MFDQLQSFMAVRRAYPSASIIPVPSDPSDDTVCFTVDKKLVTVNTTNGIITEKETGMESEFYPENI